MDNQATVFLGLALAIIMLGMGLSLTINDFKEIFKKPAPIFGGLILQLIILPLIAFGLAKTLDIPDFIAVGLIILAACPGGPTSNLIAHLAKGDTALSVSLTALSSFITILTIPFIINIGLDYFMGAEAAIKLDVVDTIKKILIVSVVPVILGMVIRNYAPKIAARSEKVVKIASAIILAVLILGIVIKEKENMAEYFAKAGFAALLLNVISMAAGFFGAMIMKLNHRQATSIAIETGIQNGTMAITIAIGILKQTELSIAPAVYSLVMFFTAGAFILLMARKNKRAMKANEE